MNLSPKFSHITWKSLDRTAPSAWGLHCSICVKTSSLSAGAVESPLEVKKQLTWFERAHEHASASVPEHAFR